MLEKILVPLDGSSLGELALIYAKELAVVFNSEVTLLSIIEKRDSEYQQMTQMYLQKITEETQKFFNRANTKVSIKSEIIDGSPATRIVEYAHQKQMSLVIVVSHGHSGIMPWTMGSTVNKVVHTIHHPVLLVRASMFKTKRRPVKVFNKILLPLDGSDIGEASLAYITEIAQKLKSEVTLLSVIETSRRVRTIGGRDYIHYPEQQIEKTKADINDYLAKTTKQLTESGINVRSIVKEGDAANEIIKFAKQSKIRLIVMSSHGRSGMSEWVFGSVSNKVLHAGKTPLLFVGTPQSVIH